MRNCLYFGLCFLVLLGFPLAANSQSQPETIVFSSSDQARNYLSEFKVLNASRPKIYAPGKRVGNILQSSWDSMRAAWNTSSDDAEIREKFFVGNSDFAGAEAEFDAAIKHMENTAATSKFSDIRELNWEIHRKLVISRKRLDSFKVAFQQLDPETIQVLVEDINNDIEDFERFLSTNGPKYAANIAAAKAKIEADPDSSSATATQPTQPAKTSSTVPEPETGDKNTPTDMATLEFSPVPIGSGGAAIDTHLAQFKVMFISLSGNHKGTEQLIPYKVSRDGSESEMNAEGMTELNRDSYFKFDFSSGGGLRESGIPLYGASSSLGDNDCHLFPQFLTWTGTVFTYRHKEKKTERDFLDIIDCFIDVVGVVSPDGKMLQSLKLWFRGDLFYMSIQDKPDSWHQKRGYEFSYQIINLPLSEELTGNDPGCLVFRVPGKDAPQHIQIPRVPNSRNINYTNDVRSVLKDRTTTYYHGTDWVDDTENNVESEIRVQLCKAVDYENEN